MLWCSRKRAQAAKDKGLELSPVAYAGWTEDAGIFSRLLPIGLPLLSPPSMPPPFLEP